MFFSSSALKLNITRARRCGFTADHAGKALAAASTALCISARLASATLACTSPVAGLNTSLKRPDVPLISSPLMKCPYSFMENRLSNAGGGLAKRGGRGNVAWAQTTKRPHQRCGLFVQEQEGRFVLASKRHE